MSIVPVLIVLGLLMLGLAMWAFLWAVNHEQFEDLDQRGQEILFDDDERDDDERDDDERDDDERGVLEPDESNGGDPELLHDDPRPIQ